MRRRKDDLSINELDLAWFSSWAASGLLFMLIFIPLACISAVDHKLDPIDVIFFTHITKLLPNKSFLDLGNLLYKSHHWPTIFSFGAMYGFMGFVMPFLFLVIKKKGWIELIVMSNGLLLGYFFTNLVGSYVFKKEEANFGIFRFTYLNFTYILLLYYIASGLIELFSNHGIRAKFDHLFMGAYGICSGWILSRSFGKESILYTGLVFLIISFISITILELTLGRFCKWAFGVIPDSAKLWILPSLSSIKRIKSRDFWPPFFIFSGVYIGFPLISFTIFKLIL
jgi:hypothetical protein